MAPEWHVINSMHAHKTRRGILDGVRMARHHSMHAHKTRRGTIYGARVHAADSV